MLVCRQAETVDSSIFVATFASWSGYRSGSIARKINLEPPMLTRRVDVCSTFCITKPSEGFTLPAMFFARFTEIVDDHGSFKCVADRLTLSLLLSCYQCGPCASISIVPSALTLERLPRTTSRYQSVQMFSIVEPSPYRLGLQFHCAQVMTRDSLALPGMRRRCAVRHSAKAIKANTVLDSSPRETNNGGNTFELCS
jgi:hypothetical protein